MNLIDRPCYKDSGDADVKCVVLHHTAGTEQGDYNTLWGDAEVSIHFLIGKTGNVYYGVRMGKQAWHCYPSYWNGLSNLNRYSIGIELSNLGDSKDPYPREQLDALDLVLVTLIRPHYGNLPIVRHRDISSFIGKIDPSDNFPWDKYSGGIAQVSARLSVTGAQLGGKDVSVKFPEGYKVNETTTRLPWVDGTLAKVWVLMDVPAHGKASKATVFFAGQPGIEKKVSPGETANVEVNSKYLGPVEVVHDANVNVDYSVIYPR